MANGPGNPFGSVATPEQIRLQRLAQLQATGRPTSGIAGAFARAGQDFKRGIEGRGRDVELDRARKNQQILAEAAQSTGKRIKSGIDPELAQILTLQEAATKLDEAGSFQDAATLRTQMTQTLQARQIRQAELRRLNADSAKSEAATLASLSAGPEEAKDKLPRLQVQRAAKLAAAEQDPDNKLLAREIDELDAAISKEITITGQTAEDLAAREGKIAPTKTTLNDLQESFVAQSAQLQSLKNLQQLYDPSLLTIKGRTVTKALRMADFAGVDLDSEEKARLDQGVKFQRQAAENLNAYIKLITGAQMSFKEEARIRQAIPDPKNMGPQAFKAAMDDSIRLIEAVLRRNEAAIRAGDLSLLPGRDGADTLDDWVTPEAAPPGRIPTPPAQGDSTVRFDDGTTVVFD
jgi:hypothetical protein